MRYKNTFLAATLLLFSFGPTWAQNLTAQVDWAQRLEMSLEQSGRIEHISVRTGDQVKAGDELLRLDPTLFTSSVTDAEARVKKAQAELKDLEDELGRARELYDRGVLATVPLRRSELAVTRARSELSAAEAALKVAKYRLESSRMIAPFDAWVVRRNAAVGQVVNSAWQPPVLIVLGQAGSYVARALVDATTAAQINIGSSLTVRLGPQSYPATVRSVSFEPDENLRYALEAKFASPDRPQVGAKVELVLP